MGMVASSIAANADAVLNASLLKLFGVSGMGNLFEYEMHQALINASPENEYFCWNQNSKDHVSMRLGGGNLKLIRSIGDLKTLVLGDYAVPTF
jgi:hypothetical protein